MFVGYVDLDDTLNAPVLNLDAARTPVNYDAQPIIRVYGPLGPLSDVTSLGTMMDFGQITNATLASPIVITSVNHGLSDGTYVTISGVLGNTAANQSTTVTVLDGDHFELDGSSGNSSYLSGGQWNVTGLYTYSVDCTSVNGFETGTTYSVLISGLVAGVPTADQQTFIVT